MFVPPTDDNGVTVGMRVAYAFDVMVAMKNVAVEFRNRGPVCATVPFGVLESLTRFVEMFAVLETDADDRKYATDVKDVRIELVPTGGNAATTLMWMPVCTFPIFSPSVFFGLFRFKVKCLHTFR